MLSRQSLSKATGSKPPICSISKLTLYLLQIFSANNFISPSILSSFFISGDLMSIVNVV